ncbi:hypothetical protein QJS04_geneDACA020589 [Acorus gramineus]|uniref:RNase H type-1 domain-containing protein n=1 Tax=Acorus gramineus TaxID=55184 RepID=A0AAV9BUU1_ACOGR|nr:hypothetical protein QJS04_geneDACA020589 [Acorus gramineus]
MSYSEDPSFIKNFVVEYYSSLLNSTGSLLTPTSRLDNLVPLTSVEAYIWKATLKALGLSHVRHIALTYHFTWFISLGSTQTKIKKVYEKEVSWEAPKEGWLKLNSDGSRSDDRFSYGVLVRDSSGFCFEALSTRVRADSINLLELKGLVEGMQLCHSLRASRVWLESDSTTAIAWIHGRGIIPWRAFRDLRTFSTLSNSLLEWKATHVYREGNQVADHLAAFQSAMGYQIHEPPDFFA